RRSSDLELDLTLDDHEELAPDVALLGEDGPGVDLEVVGQPGDLDELLAREVREQRRPLEALDLRVLREQGHGRNVTFRNDGPRGDPADALRRRGGRRPRRLRGAVGRDATRGRDARAARSARA